LTEEILKMLKDFPKPQPPGERRTLNAYRHGLTGHVRFTTAGDEQAYKKHCSGYLEDLAPKGALETDLTQSVADGRWRLKRASQMENAIVAITLGRPDQMKCDSEEATIAFAHAYAWLDRGKDLNLLTLYERRIQSNFKNDLALLELLQNQRRYREEQAAREAAEQAAAAQQAQAEAAAEAEADTGTVPVPPPDPLRRRLEPRTVFSTRSRARSVLGKNRKRPLFSPPPAEILAA
jgi:hypothetical protein